MHKTVVVHMTDVKDMVYRKLREGRSSGSRSVDHYLSRAGLDIHSRDQRHGLNAVHDFKYTEDGQTKRPSTADALHWMDYGYVAPEMLTSADPVPVGFETRPSWNEDEGDIDFGRMAAGYDDFFLGRTEQQSKPGIQLRFDCWFSCGVPNQVIAEYGRWLMRLIAGIESMGFDLTIDAYSVTNSTFRNDRDTRAVAIRVKNQNEGNDMSSYSCLFSPVGTRLIVFTAMGTAARQENTDVTGYFGTALSGRDWGLEYDRDEGIVTVTAAQMAVWNQGSAFPAKELTQKAVEAGLIPDQEI